MLLTVTTTHRPATDLGYLLHKHPARVQHFDEAAGTAHVLYPEATEDRTTAALLLEVDPIRLVRGRTGRGEGFALAQYVNDRPYAASSLLSVAIKDVFGTALTGRCKARPELAANPLPLELFLPAVRCRGGADLAVRLFAPLGWTVDARTSPLDPTIPAWGDAPYLEVRLTGEVRLADALNHLYVLLPVLDDAKHYWVGPDEVDKLVRAGGGWLAAHPERELIAMRYLAHRRALTSDALTRLADIDDALPEQFDDALAGQLDGYAPPPAPDTPPPLGAVRRAAVLAEVLAAEPRARVADLGCGEGALVLDLLDEPSVRGIVAADVSARALSSLERRLARVPDARRERVSVIQSSLTYRDDRIEGLDVAVLMEVVEHVDPSRLGALERTVFGDAGPRTVIVTTPNAEHNVRYPGLAAGAFRHRDHRFEWTRAQFAAWADHVCRTYGYAVRLGGIGPDDADVGPPSQLAVLSSLSADRP